jgi:6-pyruvoyltetrahydropterin/6-carboxytetrahydropterin synthase
MTAIVPPETIVANGLYRVEKEFRFEAAHMLPLHDGKCKRLHGHSWVGRIYIEGNEIASRGPKSGMLIDFGDLKSALSGIVDGVLDHYYLNDSTGLYSPTSEAVARYVFDALKPRFALAVAKLVKVRIEETCTSAAEYEP